MTCCCFSSLFPLPPCGQKNQLLQVSLKLWNINSVWCLMHSRFRFMMKWWYFLVLIFNPPECLPPEKTTGYVTGYRIRHISTTSCPACEHMPVSVILDALFTLKCSIFPNWIFGLLRPLMVEKVKVKEWYLYLFCDVGSVLPGRLLHIGALQSCSSCILFLSAIWISLYIYIYTKECHHSA